MSLGVRDTSRDFESGLMRDDIVNIGFAERG